MIQIGELGPVWERLTQILNEKKRNNPAKQPDYYLAYLDRQRKKIGFNTAFRNAGAPSLF